MGCACPMRAWGRTEGARGDACVFAGVWGWWVRCVSVDMWAFVWRVILWEVLECEVCVCDWVSGGLRVCVCREFWWVCVGLCTNCMCLGVQVCLGCVDISMGCRCEGVGMSLGHCCVCGV